MFPGVIDYNFLCFREAISQVFELRSKNQKLDSITEGGDDENEQKPSMTNGTSSGMQSATSNSGIITWALCF